MAERTDNALGNLRRAAEHGLKYHAVGYLNTDWGDNGHWQALPVSYLGFVYGAGVSWCYEANVNLDVPAVLIGSRLTTWQTRWATSPMTRDVYQADFAATA